MVFCPYLILGDGLRLCCVGAQYFVPFVLQHSYVRAEWYSAPTLLQVMGYASLGLGRNISCLLLVSIRMSGQNGTLPLRYFR